MSCVARAGAFEVPHVILGRQAVAHVRPVLPQKARQAQVEGTPHYCRTRTSAALAGGRYTETVLPDVV
jgi:hypothetical protein